MNRSNVYFGEEFQISKAQLKALKWLHNRGGTGVFEKNHQVLVAQGERAPIERRTWNALRDRGCVIIKDNRVYIDPIVLETIAEFGVMWSCVAESEDTNNING